MPASIEKGGLHPIKTEKRWDIIVTYIERHVSAVFLGVATLLVFAAVILRYGFGFSSSVIEEAVRYLIIWSVFIGGSLALKKNEHITIDILTMRLSERNRLILQTIAYAAGVVYCILLATKGMQLVYDSFITDERTTSAWRLPLYIPRLAIPVGAALFVIRFTQKVVENISILRSVHLDNGDGAGRSE